MHGVSMGSPWDSHRTPMELASEFDCGPPMGLPWGLPKSKNVHVYEQFDASRRGNKMRNLSRDKNESMRRGSGEGEGVPAM